MGPSSLKNLAVPFQETRICLLDDWVFYISAAGSEHIVGGYYLAP